MKLQYFVKHEPNDMMGAVWQVIDRETGLYRFKSSVRRRAQEECRLYNKLGRKATIEERIQPN